MSTWILFAIFLSQPQGVTEHFATREVCIATLTELSLICKRDFWSGICRNADDDADSVEISTELGP